MNGFKVLVGVICGNQTEGGPPPPPPPPDTYYSPLVDAVITDNGRYEGFEMVDQYTDGSLVGVHKYAGNHGDAGPFMFKRSTNGGETNTQSQITVTGHGLIDSAAHSFFVQKSGPNAGRITIAWQDAAATNLKFAYRDGVTGAFTYAGQVNAPSGFQIFPSPVVMKTMPEGTIQCGVYLWPTDPNTTPSQLAFAESDDDSETWALQSSFLSGSLFSEFDWCITEHSGVDATAKIIYVIRQWIASEGGTYYTFRKSSNGGTTVSFENVDDAGSYVNDHGDTVSGPFNRGLLYAFMPSNSPVCIKKHNEEIIIANGERGSGSGWVDYNLKFIKATPAGAFENKFSNWTRPMKVRGYNAEEIGSSLHCGYPCLFQYQEEEDGDLKLGFRDYDVSAETRNAAITTHRCQIYQGSLEDWLWMPSGAYRTDIIAPGGSLWSGYTSNFNTDHSFTAGGAIQLQPGTYGSIELMGLHDGVTIVGPETGTVTVQRISAGDYGKNFKIIAHPKNRLGVDSFIINDGAQLYFAPYIRSTGDIMIRGIKVENCRMGPQVETRISYYANLAAFPAFGAVDHNYKAINTGLWYYWDNGTSAYVLSPGVQAGDQNVKLLNCTINNVFYEGSYHGADAASPVPTNTICRNCTFTNLGRDGAQFRNGSMLIEDCYIDNAGLNGEGPHGHGFTVGANSTGLTARRITVIEAFANGCFCNVMGGSVFEVCRFNGGEYGFYMNNYAADTDDIFEEEQQTVTFKNCEFEGTLGAVRIQRDPANCPMTVNRYSTNTYIGSVNIETVNGIDDNVLT